VEGLASPLPKEKTLSGAKCIPPTAPTTSSSLLRYQRHVLGKGKKGPPSSAVALVVGARSPVAGGSASSRAAVERDRKKRKGRKRRPAEPPRWPSPSPEGLRPAPSGA
jgi:hypothetical protein